MTLPLSSLILFLHIGSAMVLVGSSLFAPLVRSALRTARTVEELRGALALGRKSAQANPAASLVLLATGVYCGRHGWWEFAWFWVAVGVWAVNSALAAAVIRPAATALARAAFAAPPGPLPAELDARHRLAGLGIAQRIMVVNDLAVLFLMLEKPGLRASLALLVAAHAVTAGWAWVRTGADRRQEEGMGSVRAAAHGS